MGGTVFERQESPGTLGLSDRERTVLYLRFFDGRTQSEIADQVGVSQVHVSRIIRTCLQRMRESLHASSGFRRAKGKLQNLRRGNCRARVRGA